MITIDKEQINEVKKEMKEKNEIAKKQKAEIKEELKELRLDIKELKKDKQENELEIQNKEKELEDLKAKLEEMELQPLFDSRIPIRLSFKEETVVVNYVLMEQFQKKLKDFRFKIKVKEGNLQINYRKDSKNKGKFILNPMDSHFETLNSIPTVVLK